MIPETPFAALALIGAPALLTNATSVLIMSTANRLGRTVSRARELAGDMAAKALDAGMRSEVAWHARVAERRVLMTMRALSSLYAALALFAASTVLALLGALTSGATAGLLVDGIAWASLATGLLGFACLIVGSGLLVSESQLAYRQIRRELRHARKSVPTQSLPL